MKLDNVEKKNIELMKTNLTMVVVNAILKPFYFVNDLVMLPLRVINIVKKSNEILNFIRMKQQVEVQGKYFENETKDFFDLEKKKLIEFIKENVELKLFDEKLLEKYKMHEILFKKEDK